MLENKALMFPFSSKPKRLLEFGGDLRFLSLETESVPAYLGASLD